MLGYTSSLAKDRHFTESTCFRKEIPLLYFVLNSHVKELFLTPTQQQNLELQQYSQNKIMGQSSPSSFPTLTTFLLWHSEICFGFIAIVVLFWGRGRIPRHGNSSGDVWKEQKECKEGKEEKNPQNTQKRTTEVQVKEPWIKCQSQPSFSPLIATCPRISHEYLQPCFLIYEQLHQILAFIMLT